MTDELAARQQFNAAFVTALAAMPDVHKDKTVKTPSFSYTYADLASIIALVRPVLAEHGLGVAQAVDTLTPGTVSVTTRIFHSGGHSESFGTLTLGGGDDARRAGSAVTYARRYSLCAALGIAPDEDTDGDGVPAPKPAAEPDTRSDGQNKKLNAVIGELNKSVLDPPDAEDWKAYSKKWTFTHTGKNSSTELTKGECGQLIDHLEEFKASIPAAAPF